MVDQPELIQNAAYIKESDLYFKSSHRHDFITHTFKDGRTLSLDGGLDYPRRVGDLLSLVDDGAYEEMCLNTETPFEEIADKLLWGTRGKDGTQPLTYRPIKTFTKEHLAAILANCPAIGPWHKKVVQYWHDKKAPSE